jgi:Flp pilus assembly protein TadD
VFQALVLSNPYDGYFHTVLGAIYQRRGLDIGAIEEYTLAIALDPANIEAWANRGELFMKTGNFQQAAADFKKAIELDPAGANKSANRARALASATYAALKATVK